MGETESFGSCERIQQKVFQMQTLQKYSQFLDVRLTAKRFGGYLESCADEFVQTGEKFARCPTEVLNFPLGHAFQGTIDMKNFAIFITILSVFSVTVAAQRSAIGTKPDPAKPVRDAFERLVEGTPSGGCRESDERLRKQ